MLKYMRNLESKINKNKTWVVIIFTESMDYSVIPVNWLNNIIDEYSDLAYVKHCVWPYYRVINDDIIDAEEPESCWPLYKIQIVHDEIFTDFKQAWYKKVYLESLIPEIDDIMETTVITYAKPSKTETERAQFTIQDLLSSSPDVDYSNIIGDGTVSLSAVFNNANNNNLTVLPMTQLNTHLIMRDIRPKVKMVEIHSPQTNDALPEFNSETNDDNKMNRQHENEDNNN